MAGSLLCVFDCQSLARIVHQLDYCELSIIAGALSEFKDASIATRSILVTLA
jgi:hypothetical protein